MNEKTTQALTLENTKVNFEFAFVKIDFPSERSEKVSKHRFLGPPKQAKMASAEFILGASFCVLRATLFTKENKCV